MSNKTQFSSAPSGHDAPTNSGQHSAPSQPHDSALPSLPAFSPSQGGSASGSTGGSSSDQGGTNCGETSGHGDAHHGALIAANLDLGHSGLDANIDVGGGTHLGDLVAVHANLDVGHDFYHC